MSNHTTPTTVLGLGAMGSTLATTLIDAGHPTTVWNRSAVKAGPLVVRGATAAGSTEAAVRASPLVVACLFDHASVHEVLDPIAGSLRGRSLVNLTTRTPDAHRARLDLWGESTYFGSDAGMASLYDLAMLSGMYAMFAGFMHGAAMVGSEGISATEFATRATPFLAAMPGGFAGFAATIDAKDYGGEGQQSLEFSDLSQLIAASTEQGVSAEVLQPVHQMIRRQIAGGHGKEGFARIFEELRSTR
jgi:3-hydroxyisobutyrate dehydrogenase-like beta-hydroxyacid dehydrogenase